MLCKCTLCVTVETSGHKYSICYFEYLWDHRSNLICKISSQSIDFTITHGFTQSITKLYCWYKDFCVHLFWRKLKHQKDTPRFSRTHFVHFLPYVGFHNKTPLHYTAFHNTQITITTTLCYTQFLNLACSQDLSICVTKHTELLYKWICTYQSTVRQHFMWIWKSVT